MEALLNYPTIFSLDEQRAGLPLTPGDEVHRTLAVSQTDVAAAALARLWHDLGLGPSEPLDKSTAGSDSPRRLTPTALRRPRSPGRS
jgi:hypothetical protein